MGARADALSLTVGGVRGRAWELINGFEIGSLSPEGVELLKAHPAVKAVYPDGDDIVTASQNLSGNLWLWGLDRIDQRAGPTYDGVFNYFYAGTGVRIYILDSGIHPHADFGSRLGPGYSAISAPNPYEDTWGHGTTVASVAAGSVTGVPKGATLSSVRVVRVEQQGGQWVGLASHSDQLEGLQWIKNQTRGIVNYSISPPPGSSFNGAIIDALNELSGLDYVVVVGAGNWDQDACIQGRNLFYPYVLVVGASNLNNNRWTGGGEASNFGPCVDLFAPGENVATVVSPGAINQQNPASGTSIAAPFVAGVAATTFQQRLSPRFTGEVGYILQGTTTNGVLNQQSIGAGSPNKLLNSLHRWVWISGPAVVQSVPGTTATWTADAVGGNGSWTYQWLASVDGGPWTQVGTNSSYTRTIKLLSNYQLRLKLIGTSLGETTPDLAPMTVTVTCGGC